ncbi:dynein heavy chain, N-terminal region 2-domain-containing protein [Pavlovales sp. CCMP2436]|nr:dynein heavy chain, N-terminal region 2-domain-containing protein [Pavlovales sp. CCMP2436]
MLQGCPFKVTFEDVWAAGRVSGIAPRVRPNMEVSVLDGKLTVIPLEGEHNLRGIRPKSDKATPEPAAAEEPKAEEEGGEGEAAPVAKPQPTGPVAPAYAWQLDSAAQTWTLVEGEAAVALLCDKVAPAHQKEMQANAAFAAAAKLPAALAEGLVHPELLCASFATAASPGISAAPPITERETAADPAAALAALEPIAASPVPKAKGAGAPCPGPRSNFQTSVQQGNIPPPRKGAGVEDALKAMDLAASLAIKEKEELTRTLTLTLGQADKADGGDNLQLLYKVKKADLDIRTKAEEIDLQFEQLVETINFLENEGVISADVAAGKRAKLEGYAEQWSGAKKAAPTVRKAIKQAADAQGSRLSEQIAAFREKSDAFALQMRASPMFELETGVDVSYKALDGFNVEVKKLEADIAAIKASTDIWEMSEALGPAVDGVAEIREELTAVKTLWDLVGVVTSTLKHWEGTLWAAINTGAMEEECKLFAKTVRSLDKRVREYGVYKGLDQVVKNFLAALPCVGDLKSMSMRERHWRQLMEITGKDIPLPFPPDFALAQLLALELHK